MLLMIAATLLCLGAIYLAALVGVLVRPRWLSAITWQRIANALSFLALSYLAAWLALTFVHLLAPQRSGVLALTQALAPLLLLPALVFIPLAFAGGTRLLRWGLVLTTLVFLVRCPPALPLGAPTALAGVPQLRVMNWNVQESGEANQIARLRPLLATKPADVVVLEEAYWGWLNKDEAIKALYPYQLANTRFAASGPVILSSYPFLANGVAQIPLTMRGWPRLIWTRLDLGAGRSVVVVAAHPESPYTSNRSDCQPPLCYDTAQRDWLIPFAREIIDPALARNEPVILSGDLNTTNREVQLGEWGRGLRDTHDRAG